MMIDAMNCKKGESSLTKTVVIIALAAILFLVLLLASKRIFSFFG